MTNKTYSCTLTQWHKVTGRLTKEFSALTKAAKAGLAETTVTEYLGEAQETRLIDLRHNCLKQIDSALVVQDANCPHPPNAKRRQRKSGRVSDISEL